jgi:phosphotransferase system  glucose/maltose/N-acetylglucosamine-specific IIC component
MADSLCSSHKATTNPALFSFHFWQCRPFFFVHLILTGLLVVSLLFTLVIHNKS